LTYFIDTLQRYLPDSNQNYNRIVKIRDYLLRYYTSALVNCLLAKSVLQTHIFIYFIELKGKSASSLQV